MFSLKKIAANVLLTAFSIAFVFNDYAAYASETRAKYFENPDSSSVAEKKFFNNDTLIIYILDAHNEFRIQKKIVEIIDFYDRQKPLRAIFAEGAPAGKVRLSLFEGLDKNIKEGILDKILKNGQIGACEYYASYRNRDILYGIEDAKLYSDNLALIRLMLEIYDENAGFFKTLEQKGAYLKNKYLRSAAAETYKSVEKEAGRLYSKITEFFENDANFKYALYEDFLNYCKIKEEFGRLNVKKAQSQLLQLQKYASAVLSYKDYSAILKAMEDKDEARSAAVIYKTVLEKMPAYAQRFPDAFKFLEINALKSELNEYKAHNQKILLLKYIEKKCGDTEKDVIFLTKSFNDVKNIYSLAITRGELLDFINRRDKLKGVSRKYLDIAQSNALSSLAENDVAELIYKNNLNRDFAFFKSVKNVIDSSAQKKQTLQKMPAEGLDGFKNVYVVVAGGFHSAFFDFLKNNKISFITLIPKDENRSLNDFRKDKYLDALRLPGRLGVQNPSYIGSAFAPPLLNILNSKADDDMKETMLKNIIKAWVESAAEYSVNPREVYFDIYLWLKNNGFGDEIILKYPSLKEAAGYAKPEKRMSERDYAQKSAPVAKKSRIFEKIKRFFSFGKSWSFPAIAVSSEAMKEALNAEGLAQIFRKAKKNKIRSFEFELKADGGEFYFELNSGARIAFRDALSVLEEASKKKEKNEVIIKFGPQESAGADGLSALAEFARTDKNNFTVINSGKTRIEIPSELKDKIKLAENASAGQSRSGQAETILEIAELDAGAIYTDPETFRRNGAYFGAMKEKNPAIFIAARNENSYGEFILKNKNATTLICKDFESFAAQKKEAKAARRNVAAVPFIQLVIGFEFFASFSTIYLQGAGYALSFLGLFFAISGPLNIIGSAMSGFLSKRFGQRNVIIANLILHCAGDSLLLLAAVSPVFLALGLGVPAMAAAAVSALLIPFLHSSLEKSGQGGKFETVYGKTKSIFWIGLAVSSIAGSWMAQFMGYAGVIAFSCVTITTLSLYSLFATSSLKNKIEDEAGGLNEKAKILNALKTVFKTKELKSIVVINLAVDTIMFVFLALAIQTMLVEAGLSSVWLGIIMFSANLTQSLACKIVKKVASFINNNFKRTLYFSGLALSAAAFWVFNNPAILVVFYMLANFWQGASSVIEPAKIEKALPDDETPYWFSARAVIVSLLAAAMQLLICLLINNMPLNAILTTIAVVLTAVSIGAGFIYKDGQNPKAKKDLFIQSLKKIFAFIKKAASFKAPAGFFKRGFRNAALMLGMLFYSPDAGLASAVFDDGDLKKAAQETSAPARQENALNLTPYLFENMDSEAEDKTDLSLISVETRQETESGAASYLFENADSEAGEEIDLSLVSEETKLETESSLASIEAEDEIVLPVASIETERETEIKEVSALSDAPPDFEKIQNEENASEDAVQSGDFATGTEIPLKETQAVSQEIMNLLISYPQLQNISGLGEVLIRQYGSQTALDALKRLGQYNETIYRVRQGLYYVNDANIGNGLGNILKDKIPAAAVLSSIEQALKIYEIESLRKAALDLKEALNYELPAGDLWKEKIPENTDALFAVLLSCGNDSKAVFDRMVFPKLFDKEGMGRHIPANFSLSPGLRSEILNSYDGLKNGFTELSFESLMDTVLEKYRRDIIIDALKQYKADKKANSYDYISAAQSLAAVPSALFAYSAAEEISIDKPIEAGSETSVYLPYLSAVNKDGSAERKIISQVKRLKGTYSNDEVKGLISGLKASGQSLFYSVSDEAGALKSAHKVLAQSALEEASFELLNGGGISKALQKRIMKKEYSKDVSDVSKWASETIQKYKSDIFMDALKEKLKEKDGKDGEKLLNSASYFDEIKSLVSNFKGFEIKFLFYSTEETQTAFNEARVLIKNRGALTGALDLRDLKREAKNILGRRVKYFPQDSVLLSKLDENDSDVMKTFYDIAGDIFFAEPAVSKTGEIVGWSWGLKESGERIAWGKKPKTPDFSDKWSGAGKSSYEIFLDLILEEESALLPENFKLSKEADFALGYELCVNGAKEKLNIFDGRQIEKGRAFIFADALAAENEKYKADRDAFDPSAAEKILSRISGIAQNESVKTPSSAVKKRFIESEIIETPTASDSIARETLGLLGVSPDFEPSKAVKDEIYAYIEENKNSAVADMPEKLKGEFEKTVFLDALMQYKEGKKLNLSDWIPFAASLLPKVAFVNSQEKDNVFEMSGSGLLEIATPVIPPAQNGFEMAFSLAFLSEKEGAARKMANSFARNHYGSSDAARDYLISRYMSAKDAKTYVYSPEKEMKLVEWLGSKEKALVKNELLKSLSGDFGRYGVSSLSKRLEKQILDSYVFKNTDRAGAAQEMRLSYEKDIELNVLAQLASRVKNAQRQRQDEKSSSYDFETQSKNNTVSGLMREKNDFEQMKLLTQKLEGESGFKYYGQKYASRILAQAQNIIAKQEQGEARINALTLKVLSDKLSPYLSGFKEYYLPRSLSGAISGYYNENASLSDEELTEKISSLFAKDIILSALIQYRETRTLQAGEYLPAALKTLAGATPLRGASNAIFFAAETLGGGKTAEQTFVQNLKSCGYQSYDETKNALLSGLDDFASGQYVCYSLKDEKKIRKWIFDNENKLIISHFNDKLYADCGAEKLSDKALRKTIFQNYSYDWRGDKKDAVSLLFKDNAQAIADDILKQSPQNAEKINAAKEAWLAFEVNLAKRTADFADTQSKEAAGDSTARKEIKDEIMLAAQEFINSNSAAARALKQNSEGGEKDVSKASNIITAAGYLDMIYQNPDYGLYSILGSKGFLKFMRSPDGKITAEAEGNSAFDVSLNVRKTVEKLVLNQKKAPAENEAQRVGNIYESLIAKGFKNVEFHEDGGYFSFVYAYKGQTLENYIVYASDRQAVSKAEIAAGVFKWLVDKGYSPRYVDDPSHERGQYFSFAGGIKLYLYSYLGDRQIIRKNSLYFDLEREVKKAFTLQRYKNAVARYYNENGYGSRLTQALTFTDNINIEEAWLGNVLYWCLPDGTELYPENYDGSLVGFDEMMEPLKEFAPEKPQESKRARILSDKRLSLKEITPLTVKPLIEVSGINILEKLSSAIQGVSNDKNKKDGAESAAASGKNKISVSDGSAGLKAAETGLNEAGAPEPADSITAPNGGNNETLSKENAVLDAAPEKPALFNVLLLAAALFAMPFVLIMFIKNRKMPKLSALKSIFAQTVAFAKKLSANSLYKDSVEDIIKEKKLAPKYIKDILQSA